MPAAQIVECRRLYRPKAELPARKSSVLCSDDGQRSRFKNSPLHLLCCSARSASGCRVRQRLRGHALRCVCVGSAARSLRSQRLLIALGDSVPIVCARVQAALRGPWGDTTAARSAKKASSPHLRRCLLLPQLAQLRSLCLLQPTRPGTAQRPARKARRTLRRGG